MNKLDSGPRHKCVVCHHSFPENRMIKFKGKWFCGLIHKLKHERKEHEVARLRLLTLALYDGAESGE